MLGKWQDCQVPMPTGENTPTPLGSPPPRINLSDSTGTPEYCLSKSYLDTNLICTRMLRALVSPTQLESTNDSISITSYKIVSDPYLHHICIHLW